MQTAEDLLSLLTIGPILDIDTDVAHARVFARRALTRLLTFGSGKLAAAMVRSDGNLGCPCRVFKVSPD